MIVSVEMMDYIIIGKKRGVIGHKSRQWRGIRKKMMFYMHRRINNAVCV